MPAVLHGIPRPCQKDAREGGPVRARLVFYSPIISIERGALLHAAKLG